MLGTFGLVRSASDPTNAAKDPSILVPDNNVKILDNYLPRFVSTGDSVESAQAIAGRTDTVNHVFTLSIDTNVVQNISLVLVKGNRIVADLAMWNTSSGNQSNEDDLSAAFAFQDNSVLEFTKNVWIIPKDSRFSMVESSADNVILSLPVMSSLFTLSNVPLDVVKLLQSRGVLHEPTPKADTSSTKAIRPTIKIVKKVSLNISNAIKPSEAGSNAEKATALSGPGAVSSSTSVTPRVLLPAPSTSIPSSTNITIHLPNANKTTGTASTRRGTRGRKRQKTDGSTSSSASVSTPVLVPALYCTPMDLQENGSQSNAGNENPGNFNGGNAMNSNSQSNSGSNDFNGANNDNQNLNDNNGNGNNNKRRRGKPEQSIPVTSIVPRGTSPFTLPCQSISLGPTTYTLLEECSISFSPVSLTIRGKVRPSEDFLDASWNWEDFAQFTISASEDGDNLFCVEAKITRDVLGWMIDRDRTQDKVCCWIIGGRNTAEIVGKWTGCSVEEH